MKPRASHLASSIPVLALFAVMIGCGSPEPSSASSTGRRSPAPPSIAIPDPIAVAEVRGEALDAAIRSYKDKVVVADFWATWCEPCVKRFPHLVEMHKKYADKGLVCVSVSMDLLFPKEGYRHEQILDVLRKQGAAFPNFIALEPNDDEKAIAARFGEYYRNIPYLVILDKAGRRIWDSS